MSSKAYLNRIETAVPPYECHGKFTRLLARLLPEGESREKLETTLRRLAIERRYTVLEPPFDFEGDRPDAFYRLGQFPSTAKRMQVYQQQALPLASLAIEPLLAGGLHSQITHLIVTSCTGFYAPGLDIDILQKFHLNPSVERNLIGYMGCYAGITGLKLAQHIVRSQPSAKVLMVNLELCSLHWRENVSFDQLISFLLFADGCAASIISADPVGLALEGFYTTCLEDSLDLMRWTISDEGFYMKLDARIPEGLTQILRDHRQKIFKGLPSQEFNSWAIHPGGRSILDAVQKELVLPDALMLPSRGILKNYGNMSSPTVMFVLKQIMEDPASQGWGCGMAFGPGLTLESFVYHQGRSS
jgi:predicted naringenin-chalcone synthase